MPVRIPAIALCCALLAGALAAQRHKQPKSNVLNEPCPELLLAPEMVQGATLTQDDFENRVVFFMFYRRDCAGCEKVAMPRLQQLYERYKDSRCVLVLAINTSFDREDYPHVADIEQTRKHLQRMRWEMPVALDFEDLSVEMFELDEVIGTPQAVVLDQHGTVRAHDWYSDEREWEKLEATLDRLAMNLNCDCHRMPREVTLRCKGSYDAFKAGDYSKAWQEADDVERSGASSDKDKADAGYMKEFIETLARRRIEKIEDDFYYDPVNALERAKPVIEKFGAVPGVKDFSDRVGKWKDSDTMAGFVKARDDFERLEGAARKAPPADDAAKAKYIEDLRAIAKRAGNNSVAARVNSRIATVEGKPQAAVSRATQKSRSGEGASRVAVKPSGASSESSAPKAKTELQASRSTRSRAERTK
ncbi:MAG: TlpA family protein disulfide reductase [Planctomycetes bacterium]|nr:TlpA family protein disulfide reductase [Planctomycetota bacterium]MCW8135668.1 TlpA family protein disulfide reductase [Planctomycetota bacterium]